jgi:hypothetical protein
MTIIRRDVTIGLGKFVLDYQKFSIQSFLLKCNKKKKDLNQIYQLIRSFHFSDPARFHFGMSKIELTIN